MSIMYSRLFNINTYNVVIFYPSASLDMFDRVEITTPGEYEIKGDTQLFMQMASDNKLDYVGYVSGPVGYFMPESEFYSSPVDLHPFVPKEMTLQVVETPGYGLDARIAFSDIPEPSSILLFLALLLRIFCRRA